MASRQAPLGIGAQRVEPGVITRDHFSACCANTEPPPSPISQNQLIEQSGILKGPSCAPCGKRRVSTLCVALPGGAREPGIRCPTPSPDSKARCSRAVAYWYEHYPAVGEARRATVSGEEAHRTRRRMIRAAPPSRGGGRDRAWAAPRRGRRRHAHRCACPRHPAPRWQGGSTRPALSEPAVWGRSR